MVISSNSQLGLMLFEINTMKDYLSDSQEYLKKELRGVEEKLNLWK
jgi:hypothetical protein